MPQKFGGDLSPGLY